MIKANDIVFEYIRRDLDGNVDAIVKALDGINIDIKDGEFVALLGHNGSGKSTFAKHLNGLLTPSEGTLYINGYDIHRNSSIDEYGHLMYGIRINHDASYLTRNTK